jgi:hypothetical protein
MGSAAATATAAEKQQSTKSFSGKCGNSGQCSPCLNPSSFLSSAMSVQGGIEIIILSAHAESIILLAHAESTILSALPAESMILSVPPAKSTILSVHAESIILSVGGTKQQSTKSCSGKFSNNGGGRGNSGGGKGFDIGSGDANCSDDRNSNGNFEHDSSNVDSGDDDHAKSIMLSAGGAEIITLSTGSAESIILSVPSLKLNPLKKS